jgi:AcrR family transcriptional regulator
MDTQATPGRRERKREATRSQIVAAAKALFDEQRYDDVTIDEITERADVAKGTFYLHFRHKEDVASDVYDNSVKPAMEAVNAALAGTTTTARESLAAFFHAIFTPALANPRLAQAVLSYSMSQMYAEPEASEDLFAATLIRIVSRGQASGELRADWTTDEMAMMVGAFFGTSMWTWVAFSHEQSLSDRIERSLDMCFNGIKRA